MIDTTLVLIKIKLMFSLCIADVIREKKGEEKTRQDFYGKNNLKKSRWQNQ
jgi:hypothetical protein